MQRIARFSFHVTSLRVLSVLLVGALSACDCGNTSVKNVPITVEVDPTTVKLAPGAQQRFTATVTHSEKGVTWTTRDTNGGTIDGEGVYTAPEGLGVFHVRATSNDDSKVFAEATITVVSPITVTISPAMVTMVAGSTQQFLAAVAGAADTSVVWSVAAGDGQRAPRPRRLPRGSTSAVH